MTFSLQTMDPTISGAKLTVLFGLPAVHRTAENASLQLDVNAVRYSEARSTFYQDNYRFMTLQLVKSLVKELMSALQREGGQIIYQEETKEKTAVTDEESFLDGLFKRATHEKSQEPGPRPDWTLTLPQILEDDLVSDWEVIAGVSQDTINKHLSDSWLASRDAFKLVSSTSLEELTPGQRQSICLARWRTEEPQQISVDFGTPQILLSTDTVSGCRTLILFVVIEQASFGVIDSSTYRTMFNKFEKCALWFRVPLTARLRTDQTGRVNAWVLSMRLQGL
ncbi:hypothetical protein SISNIDRAFT_108191 [Sistotremastrum niveocremeum HHB9708]|uniref:Uncharacterized protein n=1 Tax=Sistotremastrum niveocremeum HHB9708 TaxID=1314777 RepID=A0A164TYV6_9AGAM|nr:hypothetical protein SISNIDRAFT_108191 [Sistotremastrum niveocremeum HHB9708]